MEIRDFLTKYFHFTDEELIQKTLECAHVVKYKSGSIYLNQGEPYLYESFLMNDGLIAGYSSTSNDREAYVHFAYHVGQSILRGFSSLPKKSDLTFTVIEDSTVLRIPLDVLPELMKYREYVEMMFSQLDESLKFHLEISTINAIFDVEERLDGFEQAFPKLYYRISAPMKASLLGVSVRTLYRALKDKKEKRLLRQD